MLNGQPLEVVDTFKYLGSETAPNGDVTCEIESRTGKAAGSFNILKSCLWSRPDVTSKTKARVYDAAVRPILLYGCECWPVTQDDLDSLEVSERRWWRSALGVRLNDRVSNEELGARFHHHKTLRVEIQSLRLRWLGHLLRMPANRLPSLALRSNPPPPQHFSLRSTPLGIKNFEFQIFLNANK